MVLGGQEGILLVGLVFRSLEFEYPLCQLAPPLPLIVISVEKAPNPKLAGAISECDGSADGYIETSVVSAQSGAVYEVHAPLRFDTRPSTSLVIGIRMGVPAEPQGNRSRMVLKVCLEESRVWLVVDEV